jgi:hypothetical protein
MSKEIIKLVTIPVAILGTVVILLLVIPWSLMNHTTNTVNVIHKNLPGLGSYHEIGWSTVVGNHIVNGEPNSGTHYVVVCLGNQTNELRQLRACHINMMPGVPISISDMVWYDDSTTPPTPKVYVIAYRDFQRGITDTYYVKWNAALSALHLIPKKDKK